MGMSSLHGAGKVFPPWEWMPSLGVNNERFGGEYGCLSDKPACSVASQHDNQHVQFAEMNRRLVGFL